ncbi:hypothetical protein GDI3120 [Gluconacetobacter diazotrophicus PA1 5]|uniref:Uncharacterized protein n=1 Tax=Gluconacetobacter diazotrophicus (strain ATCC 49037 / DSM 5601 / CCUG 37298 / CIP 103539 / LMG 7603 / PAl5) TaxID=272568 RepID=A9HSD5_GLUDA|nr:hypothetical protein GDI3120 [Gluconacetobacter diazotrophicus PA1 5]
MEARPGQPVQTRGDIGDDGRGMGGKAGGGMGSRPVWYRPAGRHSCHGGILSR